MLEEWTAIAAHQVAAALNWLWPPLCPRCGARARRPRERYCETCWARLRPLRPPEVRWTLSDGMHRVRATAAFAVDDLFLDMLTTSKYRKVRPVGTRLAEAAGRRLVGRLPSGIFVPVPLTRAKRRERGFNQAEDLAHVLARRTGGTVRTDLLVRRRGGRALAGLPREERALAVRGAFAARRPAAPDHQAGVRLVDDVITTGSTALACAAALGAAGWGVVGIVSMARAFEARADAVRRDLEVMERL